MKTFVDKAKKRYVRVEVMEPVVITTKEHLGWSSSFTTYLIRIETNHWAFSSHKSEVRRRYSEFCWLQAKLAHHHPNKVVPPLPPKRFFHMTKFDPKVIEDRCQALEKFLQRVMRSYVFLSDAAFHLFLQSELTVPQIEAKLHEEIKPNYVKRLQHLTSSDGSEASSTDGPTYERFCSSGSDRSHPSSSIEDNDSDRASSSGGAGSDVEIDFDKLECGSYNEESSDSLPLNTYEVELHQTELSHESA